MLTRRRILVSLAAASAAAAAPSLAEEDKTLRLGAIGSGAPLAANSGLGKVLVGALAERGYSLGKNLAFDARGAMAEPARLPDLIEELRAAGAKIFLGVGYPSAVAAKAAGVPTVVAWGAGDPVESSLVESWAHPGGVVTGISDVAATLTAKRLELLKAFLPQMKRVAMLWNRDDLGMSLRYQTASATAKLQGLAVVPLGVREPEDFEAAFATMDRDKPDAILMVADALTSLNRKRVFDFAASRRLPAIFEYDSFARDGGLMSYGPDLGESLSRAASMIDRIFKGVRPGDIPFEQPTRYLFVVNMKTARAMGLEPPVTLLALADDVIE
jgi:putative tryptophan/tyrosine transport system substrate-binding protein